MATITITVPDAVLPRLQAAFGGAPAVKAALIDYLKTTVRNAEAEAARRAQVTTTDTDFSGIS